MTWFVVPDSVRFCGLRALDALIDGFERYGIPVFVLIGGDNDDVGP